TPTATAWLPLGFRTSQAVSLEPASILCSAWLSSRRETSSRSTTLVAKLESRGAVARLDVGIVSVLPEIDGGRLGLPYLGLFDARQHGERAVFGTERNVLVSLGKHGRLAGDRIAHHAETVLGTDDESEEAVQVVQACLQRLAESHAPRDLVRQIGGRHFGVVLGLEGHAF